MAALLSALGLFGVWAASPALVGRAEPWDAEWPFYLLASLGLGAGEGLAFPHRYAAAFLGGWGGQMLALLVLPGHDRAWFAVGAVSSAIGTLVFVAGVAIGSVCRGLAHRVRARFARLPPRETR